MWSGRTIAGGNLNQAVLSPVLFSALGAAVAFAIQQVLEVWKTRAVHKQELQRRFFEVKLQAAIDLAKALDVLVASHQARLADVAERTRDDDHFGGLAVARDVVNLHAKTIETEYDRYASAFAVLELVFDGPVLSAIEGGAFELVGLWRQFDDEWQVLTRRLESLIPEQRMQEMRTQSEQGQYDESARSQMEDWMAEYRAGIASLRRRIPRLAAEIQRAEAHRVAVLLAIRQEMKPYRI